ncbi:hypothetical protein J1C56_13525 [Aminobacter anthyllidis]|uniref:Transmembrane protein n=1 Tax=Aminobacter anthyllidis TaxID=1035067 RepID=A0A9X1D4C8_9HYPH|nr:hypothetical protein [Aminobacter anthyllidis]MBT1156615.1 hypothetical protein [Aminobacter anthyllidis]MDH4988392.1 hypothetical protein [Aminobacter anthyllidis]
MWWHRLIFWKQPVAPPATSAVEELIDEAELVSKYAVRAGLLADGDFFRRFAAAKVLQDMDRIFTNSAVIELQSALAASRVAIPAATVSALQSGWRPNKERLRDKLKNLGFVLAALLLMFAAGNLTLTYKSGATLYEQLSLLTGKNPGLHYSRLERQLLIAEHQLPGNILVGQPPVSSTDGNGAAGLPDAPKTVSPAAASQSGTTNAVDAVQRNLIAQDASFQYVYELTMLDKELKLVKEKSDAFLAAADAQLAVLGRIRNAVCWAGALLGQGCPATATNSTGSTPQQVSDDITKQFEEQYASFDVSSLQNFCQYLGEIERAKSEQAGSSPFITQVNYLFDDAFGINTVDLMRQNCRMNLNYYSQSIPNLIDIQNKISGRLATYSYLALPALYGALGSLMYFMRRILDPFLPNPSLLRMIYRVALGALAGMVLAWFWDGTFNNNEAFQTIGFGLFTLAFVFGFAIDVFFALLDRFVSLSTAAVSRIGGP